jgi:Chaperone of endosialidase
MTQYAQPTLDAAVDDGITLATKFNGAMGALYSTHAGAAAPPSPVKGQGWVDTSQEAASTPVFLMKQFTGTVWRTLGTLNLTTGAYTTAGGLPLTGGTVTGPILFPTGAENAPSISFAGDTDLGIYRVAADQLAFSTAGVQRVLLTGTTFDVLTGLARVAGASATLNLDRNVGTSGASVLNFRVGTSARWGFQVTGVESTGEAGSNLFLQLFNDAGALTVNYLQFERSGRRMAINGTYNSAAIVSVRTNAAAAGEDAIDIMNVNTDANGYVGMNFRTAAGALRAALRGERPGNNHGDLGVWTATSGVLAKAATFRSGGNLDVVGAITSAGAAVTSTRAVKKDIKVAPSQLERLKKMRVVNFKRTECEDPREELGFIAEEVAELFPSAVTQDGAIHLMDLIASLTSVVQEQQSQIDELKKALGGN